MGTYLSGFLRHTFSKKFCLILNIFRCIMLPLFEYVKFLTENKIQIRHVWQADLIIFSCFAWFCRAKSCQFFLIFFSFHSDSLFTPFVLHIFHFFFCFKEFNLSFSFSVFFSSSILFPLIHLFVFMYSRFVDTQDYCCDRFHDLSMGDAWSLYI